MGIDKNIEFDSISSILKQSGGDVVLDVSFDGKFESENLFLTFNVLSKNDEDITYATRNYNISKINGLFDIFDDFCHGRIRFFSSGMNVQNFLLSLYESEEIFFKKHGFDFIDYYGVINNETVETVNSDSYTENDVMKSKVSDGYGISTESYKSHLIRQKLLSEDGYLMESVNILVDSFYKNKTIDDDFCAICIDTTGKSAKMMIDDTIGLPIVFHNKRFMHIFLYNLAEPFAFGGFIPMNSSNTISVDSWKIRPSTTIGEIVSICENNGILKFEYDKSHFGEKCNFIDGNCETIDLSKEKFDNMNLVASII